jgi:5-formyltetrahydrofolate cyclo-ligase
MQSKSELRSYLRKQRQIFENQQKLSFFDSVSDRPEWLALLDRHHVIAGYLAFGSEVNITAMMEWLDASGKAVALPAVADRATPLAFRQWTPGDPLETASFGFLQPLAAAQQAVPTLILVPLVGFDRAMNRLGQGAGHYDRAFQSLPHARRLGIAWSVQEVAQLPIDPWDVPLDAVLTEKEWISAADSRIEI